MGCAGPQGQLIGVAISFLRNFGLLSGASGALGALSAGVGALAGDEASQRQRQEARAERQIGGVGQGLVEGGAALGQGFLRGVTGLVSKPVQGAQAGGASGEGMPGLACADWVAPKVPSRAASGASVVGSTSHDLWGL